MAIPVPCFGKVPPIRFVLPLQSFLAAHAFLGHQRTTMFAVLFPTRISCLPGLSNCRLNGTLSLLSALAQAQRVATGLPFTMSITRLPSRNVLAISAFIVNGSLEFTSASEGARFMHSSSDTIFQPPTSRVGIAPSRSAAEIVKLRDFCLLQDRVEDPTSVPKRLKQMRTFD